ncbi:FAR1-related sequence 5-like protein, partial [Tanacetum coccineum]
NDGMERDQKLAIFIGKVFDTPDDAYTFYNQYAFTHGFGIRKHWDYKNKVTNEVYRKWYVCNKEGFKNVKDDSTSVDTKKRRRDLRTGCQARLRITITKDERWCVDFFDDTHNHDLSITPTKVMKHRSHGKFHRSMACKSLMLELGQSGMRPCHVKKAVNAMKPPYVADVTSKQCSDILSEQRKQYKGKEFYGLIKHFQDKASVDMNQYFKIDLNSDGSPRNIFWADGRSRDAYIKFGDVVVFDVTYLTNKFKFPFAPFVGVNHHGQSILFGAALLENEKEETFQWLFEQFLKHQLEHLRPFKARYSDFNESYKKWVKSDTIEEFETQWDVLRDKYDLKSSNWMMEMYDQRKYWVWFFWKDGFFAGMTTNGRSESIHSFFDGFVNSNTMLNEFVIQYDKAVNSRRAAEEDEDFKTMNSRAVLSSVHPIEAKAGKCYTRKIFEKFEKEWKEATNNLTHNTLNKSLEQHVETLPDQYILPRWTLDSRYKAGNHSIGIKEINNESGVSALTLWCVHSNSTKAIEQAKDCPSEITRLNTILVKFLEDQISRKKAKESEDVFEDNSVGASQVDMMPQICVRDPVVKTKTKGRPKIATRVKSPIELQGNKKKTCSYCHELGHNITGCPKKKLVRNKQQIRGDSKTRMAVIWNPTVRKSVGIVVIPKVGYKRTIVGFGVCPDTSDPKLVKISAPFKTCDLMMLQVFVNGVIYFRASDFNFVNQVRTNFIISFDLKSGKFGEVCLPQRLVHTPYLNLDVVKVNESLGLLEYYKEGDMRVCGAWTRKDDASKTFSKIYIVKVVGSFFE